MFKIGLDYADCNKITSSVLYTAFHSSLVLPYELVVSQVLGVNVSFLDCLKGILKFQCKWIKHCYLL